MGSGGLRNADFRVGIIGGSYASKELVRKFLTSAMAAGAAAIIPGEVPAAALPCREDAGYRGNLPLTGAYEVWYGVGVWSAKP